MSASYDLLRKWNDRLARHFFRTEMAGQEVLLFTTKALLDEIGADIGGTGSFLQAIATRPPGHQNKGLCQMALREHESWRSRLLGVSYPPYIAFLALFVLAAAEQESDSHANAYYPQLARLLGSPHQGPPPSFNHTEQLWQDLAWWANEHQHEQLGRFTFRRRGHLTHVGLPRAQTLLSREERQALPGFFEAADLYPGEQLSDKRLTQLLLQHGSPWLHARTRRLLTATAGPADDQTLLTALLELVQDELRQWDGHAPAPSPGSPDATSFAPRAVRAGLRLFVRDQGLGRLALRFRFRAAQELPASELQLRHGALCLTCYALPGGDGWSSELALDEGAYDAARHDWQHPLALQDAEQGYTARFRGGAVRLLLPAERHGLPKGWLESESLEDDGPFRLLVHASQWAVVQAWGAQHCGQFQAVAGATVPAGWQWAEGRQPRQSCQAIPALAMPERTTARLAGGLRTASRSNEYLRFALPHLLLSGATTGVVGFLNDQPLARLASNEVGFALPTTLAAETSHWLEVRQGEQVLLRRAVRVSEGYRATSMEATGRNAAGQQASASEPRMAGALLHPGPAGGDLTDASPFPRPLPTQLARTLILVGERPGQTSVWPAEPLPTTWQPVWAVGKTGRDQWEPFFCGTSAQLAAGRPGPPVASGSGRKAWRNVTYGQRKHTTSPKMSVLAQLWKAYQHVGATL